MPKKKTKVTKTDTKREKQREILEKGVYEIFDRTPIGSVISSNIEALLDKLNKV